jgi:NADPH:quinone reductase-like Zn-dependent oxidoreductase
MRAVAVRAFRGAPEVMDLDPPTPGPGEVRVRMAAAGLNPFDWKIADGVLDGHRPHRFPLILGVDGSGWVESRGVGVRRFDVGDPIFGQFLHDPVGTGTFAEWSTVPESIGVARFPPELGPVAAAALPTAGMTALDALDRLDPGPGSTLAIVGASGGIGSIATQIASSRGISVLGVARRGSAERIRSYGANEVLEYSSEGLSDAIRNHHPEGIDALLDLVSRPPEFSHLARVVRPGGRAASTVYAADPNATQTHEVDSFNIDLQPSSVLLERLVQEVVVRHLTVPVEQTIGLEDVPQAIIESRAGRSAGKTVVVLSGTGNVPSRTIPGP